jgi:dihydrofolate reductase
MTATYTWDVFSSVDGWGTHDGHWGAYWGKQGPELIEHRRTTYESPQRMVFGANTFKAFLRWMKLTPDSPDDGDTWSKLMQQMPAYVVSSTVSDTSGWPNATVLSGDVVDAVTQLKEESDVPLRSHGSLMLNRSLMAAGLVDQLQITMFPVITGQSGDDPLYDGAADFDLELLGARTLDRHIQELTYRPTLHVRPNE